MSWVLTLLLDNGMEDKLYFDTRENARIKKRFYSAIPDDEPVIGYRVVSSRITKL